MSSPFEVNIEGKDIATIGGSVDNLVDESVIEEGSMAENTEFGWMVGNDEANMLVDSPRDLWDAVGHFKLFFFVETEEEIADVLRASNSLFESLKAEYGVEEEEEEKDRGGRRESRSNRSRNSRGRDNGRNSRRSGGNNSKDNEYNDLDDSPGSITDGQYDMIDDLLYQLNQPTPDDLSDYSKQEASDMIGDLLDEVNSARR